MAINLQDIRDAVKDYLDTKVTTTVSEFRPDVPNTINPGEHFKFDITATNAKKSDGGLRLINVRYHLKVDKVNGSAIVKLIVPGKNAGFGYAWFSGPSLDTDTELLAPGKQVTEAWVQHYGIPDDTNTLILEVGETDTIKNIEGVATDLGSATISCDVAADMDITYLIPTGEESSTSSRQLDVV